MFKVIVYLEEVGEYDSFAEAFAVFFRGIKKIVDEGTSWQALESTNYLVFQDQGQEFPISWYESRDIAYTLGLMVDGELKDPLPEVAKERFLAAFSVASSRN